MHIEWMQSRRVLENVVGASLLLSASVHGLLTPDHFQEWWGYGVGFLAASLFLAGFGLLMITDAIQPRYMPGDPESVRLIAYIVGIAGTLALPSPATRCPAIVRSACMPA